jgi:alkylhydroperoxidase family enzyme
MTLISYVDDSIYQERLGSPQVANLLRVLFHSPRWAEAFVRLVGVQMTALSLPPREREIVILLVGYLLEADYVVAQHESISLILGVSEDQRLALRERRFDSPVLSNRDKALAGFVAALADRDPLHGVALARAKDFFTEAELVEVTGVQGLAVTVAAITRVFDVDIDPLAGEDLLRFSQAMAEG